MGRRLFPGRTVTRWHRATLPRYCRSMRRLWTWLKERYWGGAEHEISVQGFEYDEKTRKVRPK
jgi:hypothetical protein